MKTRKKILQQRAQVYGSAIQEQRQEAERQAKRHPAQAPEPIRDALAHAYERGYRDALSDIRKDVINLESTGRQNKWTMHQIDQAVNSAIRHHLRPMR